MENGREKAGVSWEVDIETVTGTSLTEKNDNKGGEKVFVPWKEFKATYRGKPKDDAGGLKTENVRRIGFMMRSYFGKQKGDFSVELKSLAARKIPTDYRPLKPQSKDEGRSGWFYGLCTVS